MTDGVVENTAKIINLVKNNASLITRVHIFGVGNGADKNLIIECAEVGFGHHYFIYNEEEIEEKVIMSLTKTHLDYQFLTEFKVFDEKKNHIPIESKQN